MVESDCLMESSNKQVPSRWFGSEIDEEKGLHALNNGGDSNRSSLSQLNFNWYVDEKKIY